MKQDMHLPGPMCIKIGISRRNGENLKYLYGYPAWKDRVVFPYVWWFCYLDSCKERGIIIKGKKILAIIT